MDNSPEGISVLGSALMALVGFGAFAITNWYLKLDWITTFIITAVVTIAFGFIYNLVAHLRGAKKIHWLDFVFSLLPWDF